MVASAVVTDLAFTLAGDRLPVDHGQMLANGLCALLPWLLEEPLAAVHPVRGAKDGSGRLYIGPRSRLVLRLPIGRIDDARQLTGKTLACGAVDLVVGHLTTRAVTPSTTLHAAQVAAPGADESEFVAWVNTTLAALSVHCDLVCGRPSSITTGLQTRVTGFSLLLHGVSPRQSLVVQEYGLGPHRLLGCGVFLPHKSVASVASERDWP